MSKHIVQIVIGGTSAGKSELDITSFYEAYYVKQCEELGINPYTESKEAEEIRSKVLFEQKNVLEKCGIYNMSFGYLDWSEEKERDVIDAKGSTGMAATKYSLNVKQLLNSRSYWPESKPDFIAFNHSELTDDDIEEIFVRKVEDCETEQINVIKIEIGGPVSNILVVEEVLSAIGGGREDSFKSGLIGREGGLEGLQKRLTSELEVISKIKSIAENLADYVQDEICSVNVLPVVDSYNLFTLEDRSRLTNFTRAYKSITEKLMPFIKDRNFSPGLWTKYDKVRFLGEHKQNFKTMWKNLYTVFVPRDFNCYDKGDYITWSGTDEEKGFVRSPANILRSYLLRDVESIEIMKKDEIKSQNWLTDLIRKFKWKTQLEKVYGMDFLYKV